MIILKQDGGVGTSGEGNREGNRSAGTERIQDLAPEDQGL